MNLPPSHNLLGSLIQVAGNIYCLILEFYNKLKIKIYKYTKDVYTKNKCSYKKIQLLFIVDFSSH